MQTEQSHRKQTLFGSFSINYQQILVKGTELELQSLVVQLKNYRAKYECENITEQQHNKTNMFVIIFV